MAALAKRLVIWSESLTISAECVIFGEQGEELQEIIAIMPRNHN